MDPPIAGHLTLPWASAASVGAAYCILLRKPYLPGAKYRLFRDERHLEHCGQQGKFK